MASAGPAKQVHMVPPMDPSAPTLSGYIGKRVNVKLNGSRLVTGRLRGFDAFLNLYLEEGVEEASAADRRDLGATVSGTGHGGGEGMA